MNPVLRFLFHCVTVHVRSFSSHYELLQEVLISLIQHSAVPVESFQVHECLLNCPKVLWSTLYRYSFKGQQAEGGGTALIHSYSGQLLCEGKKKRMVRRMRGAVAQVFLMLFCSCSFYFPGGKFHLWQITSQRNSLRLMRWCSSSSKAVLQLGLLLCDSFP